MITLQDFLVVSVTLGIVAYLHDRRSKQRRTKGCPLPPSPKGIPLLGNALQIPSHRQWLAYAKLGTELKSDIIHLNAAGESIIILNTLKPARELFEKRSSIYSSRRQAIMSSELMGWWWLLSSLPYGDAWRERRRLFQKYFHPSDLKTPQSRSLQYVRRMLPQLLDTPEDFFDHARHLVGGVTFSLAYGISMKSSDDPFIKLAEDATIPALEAIVPGAFLVDNLPFLRYIPDWFPGAGFKSKAKLWRGLMERFRNEPFAAAEQGISAGTAQASLTSMALEKIGRGDGEHQRTIIRDTAAMFFTAGSDTTLSSITHFALAMICFPEVQERARKELDTVLGVDRLPDYSDEPQLPYISAIVQEVLRWRPAVAIGVPHYSTEDDIYEGYFIPKESVVIGNAWAMLHNTENFPDPDEFKPERFLKDGQLNKDIILPSDIVFGFGRRICPGAHIAMSTLWLTVASVLASFTLSKEKDKNGQVMEPTLDCLPGLISHPTPFKCVFKPRSSEVEMAIRHLENHEA